MNSLQLKEYAQEQQLIREGKTLVPHDMKRYAGGRSARKEGEAEAAELKLTGVIRKLFLREREEGWIGAGQFVEAQEQGLLDEIITPLTLGLVHGPLPASTTAKTNPTSGRLEPEQHASGVETAEKAVPSIVGEIGELIKTYGVRLFEIIAGGILVLFGLVTLARGGQAPSVLPVPV